MTDAPKPRPPEQVKPITPASPGGAPQVSQKAWEAKRQEQIQPPGPQKLNPGDKVGTAADRGRQPADAGKPRMSYDMREWTPPPPSADTTRRPGMAGTAPDVKRATQEVTKDVNQYRPPGGGPVDVKRLTNDVTKDLKQLSDQRANGGGAFLKVELSNVQTGKTSEARDIKNSLMTAAAKDGVIVSVTVRDGNQIKSVDGQVLKTVTQQGKPAPPVLPNGVPPGVAVPRIVPHLHGKH